MTPGREFVSCCFPLKAVNFAFVVSKMLVPIHNPIMAFFSRTGVYFRFITGHKLWP